MPQFGGKLPADKAFDLMRNKDLQERDGIGYLFASTLSFPVDKKKVIEAGIVAKEDYDKILDTITLKITKKNLNKGDIAVLNVLKNNDWTRPIYFCITIGSDFYPTRAIDEYSQCEGLAYRFVPIRKNRQPNTEAMYDNMMNKFRYRMAGKNIYLDETNARMCKTVRQQFAVLAAGLIDKGDSTRALEVLRRAEREVPESLLAYDYTMLIFADAYYRAGGKERADYILGKIIDVTEQNLAYVLSLPLSKQSYVSPDISLRQSMGVLQQCAYLANTFNSDLAKRVQPLFDRYYQTLAPRLQ